MNCKYSSCCWWAVKRWPKDHCHTFGRGNVRAVHNYTSVWSIPLEDWRLQTEVFFFTHYFTTAHHQLFSNRDLRCMNPVHYKDGPPSPHASCVYRTCLHHRNASLLNSLWLSSASIGIKGQKAVEAITEIAVFWSKTWKGFTRHSLLLWILEFSSLLNVGSKNLNGW